MIKKALGSKHKAYAVISLATISSLLFAYVPAVFAIGYDSPSIFANMSNSTNLDTTATVTGSANGAVIPGPTCDGLSGFPGAETARVDPLGDTTYYFDGNTSDTHPYNMDITTNGRAEGCGEFPPSNENYSFSFTADISGLSNGSHTMTVQATSQDENCYCDTTTGTPSASNDQTVQSQISFTVQHVPVTGVLSVAADRSTNWKVNGVSGASYAGSGTSASYNSAPSDTYTLVDQSNFVPYGFQDNPTFTMAQKPSLFARLINSAEASSCSGWRCVLSSGGSVSYHMQTTFCKINITSTLDNQNTSGMAFNITEGYDPIHGSPPDPSASNSPNAASGNTVGGVTVVNTLLTDPSVQQSYLITAPATITTSGGGTADLDISHMVNSTSCNAVNAGNNQAAITTLTLPYVTRAELKIQ